MNFTNIYEQLDKLFEHTDSYYYRVEVFDNNFKEQGGLFRGLGKLLKDLWDNDNDYYDDINEPLSRLEYLTPYPDGLDDTKIKFAYKQDFWNDIIEEIEDIKISIAKVDWSLKVSKLQQPSNIIYEDYAQIAYIE